MKVKRRTSRVIGLLVSVAFGFLLAGCGKHHIERSEYQRGILVEKDVYEYAIGAGLLGDPNGILLQGQLLPRHRFTENLELLAIPLPLFHYRVLNRPVLELGVHFGSYFLPIPTLGEAFVSRDPEYTTGSKAWYWPNNIMLGLQGKTRFDGRHYAKFQGSQELYFDDFKGPLTLDARFGRQVAAATAVELGVFSQMLPDGFAARTTGNSYLNHVDLTLNLHLNGFRHFNLNPYAHFVRYIDNPFFKNSWQAGFLTTLFW